MVKFTKSRRLTNPSSYSTKSRPEKKRLDREVSLHYVASGKEMRKFDTKETVPILDEFLSSVGSSSFDFDDITREKLSRALCPHLVYYYNVTHIKLLSHPPRTFRELRHRIREEIRKHNEKGVSIFNDDEFEEESYQDDSLYDRTQNGTQLNECSQEKICHRFISPSNEVPKDEAQTKGFLQSPRTPNDFGLFVAQEQSHRVATPETCAETISLENFNCNDSSSSIYSKDSQARLSPGMFSENEGFGPSTWNYSCQTDDLSQGYNIENVHAFKNHLMSPASPDKSTSPINVEGHCDSATNASINSVPSISSFQKRYEQMADSDEAEDYQDIEDGIEGDDVIPLETLKDEDKRLFHPVKDIFDDNDISIASVENSFKEMEFQESDSESHDQLSCKSSVLSFENAEFSDDDFDHLIFQLRRQNYHEITTIKEEDDLPSLKNRMEMEEEINRIIRDVKKPGVSSNSSALYLSDDFSANNSSPVSHSKSFSSQLQSTAETYDMSSASSFSTPPKGSLERRYETDECMKPLIEGNACIRGKRIAQKNKSLVSRFTNQRRKVDKRLQENDAFSTLLESRNHFDESELSPLIITIPQDSDSDEASELTEEVSMVCSTSSVASEASTATVQHIVNKLREETERRRKSLRKIRSFKTDSEPPFSTLPCCPQH